MSPRKCLITLLSVSAVLSVLGPSAGAAEPELAELTGPELAQAVADRLEGRFVRQQLTMTLENRRGQTRRRSADYLRATDDQQRKALIRFSSPLKIRSTAFLTHDYRNPERSDQQWTYLPALRKPRRVSTAERGNYFFGTDFTYEDMKSALKFPLRDYRFKTLEHAKVLPQRTATETERWLQAIPADQEIAKELGYGRVIALIDCESWMPIVVHYWDAAGKPLKRVEVTEIEQVDGIWTAHRIAAINLKTGHRTELRFSNVSYPDALPKHHFAMQRLGNGS